MGSFGNENGKLFEIRVKKKRNKKWGHLEIKMGSDLREAKKKYGIRMGGDLDNKIGSDLR